jgi:hypothetical protein
VTSARPTSFGAYRAALAFLAVAVVSFVVGLVLRAPPRVFGACAHAPIEVSDLREGDPTCGGRCDPDPLKEIKVAVTTLPVLAEGRTLESSAQSGCAMSEEGHYVQQVGRYRVRGTFSGYKGNLQSGSLAIQETPACNGWRDTRAYHFSRGPTLRLRRWSEMPREILVLTSDANVGTEHAVFYFEPGPRGTRVLPLGIAPLVGSALVAAALVGASFVLRKSPRRRASAALLVAAAGAVLSAAAAWLLGG